MAYKYVQGTPPPPTYARKIIEQQASEKAVQVARFWTVEGT